MSDLFSENGFEDLNIYSSEVPSDFLQNQIGADSDNKPFTDINLQNFYVHDQSENGVIQDPINGEAFVLSEFLKDPQFGADDSFNNYHLYDDINSQNQLVQPTPENGVIQDRYIILSPAVANYSHDNQESFSSTVINITDTPQVQQNVSTFPSSSFGQTSNNLENVGHTSNNQENVAQNNVAGISVANTAIANVAKSAQTSKPTKRKQNRSRVSKKDKKLYEMPLPFKDEKEEKKRLNAIKAHKTRVNNNKKFQVLKEENDKLKKEKNELKKEKDELKKIIDSKIPLLVKENNELNFQVAEQQMKIENMEQRTKINKQKRNTIIQELEKMEY